MTRYALVTGANRGLGLSIVKGLAAADVFVILGMRDPSSFTEALPKNCATVQLDVDSDDSITAAVEHIQSEYHQLDILINNAGVGLAAPTPTLSSLRAAYHATLSTNVVSVAALTAAFQPLLARAAAPLIVNVSSARASLTRSTEGRLPPSVSVPYCVSKAALNMLTVELGKALPAMRVYTVSPGHLKTAFNGFRGKKDPAEGARVVVELCTDDEERYGNGFWEWEEGGMRMVEW